MAIEFIKEVYGCITVHGTKDVAYAGIFSRGIIEIDGTFDIEELEQILNKMKELRSNANRTIPE